MITELQFPPDGISLQKHDDPTGNGMKSVQAFYRDPDGGLVEASGVHFVLHNSAGIALVLTNINAGGVFEQDPSTGKIKVL